MFFKSLPLLALLTSAFGLPAEPSFPTSLPSDLFTTAATPATPTASSTSKKPWPTVNEIGYESHWSWTDSSSKGNTAISGQPPAASVTGPPGHHPHSIPFPTGSGRGPFSFTYSSGPPFPISYSA
ncbi:hypothetical protein F4804DRAFT_335168 [Jackrogersella minutella]|nr:hypothetical protein F4804DRAFT_335168 [Jackrogersella minutella]